MRTTIFILCLLKLSLCAPGRILPETDNLVTRAEQLAQDRRLVEAEELLESAAADFSERGLATDRMEVLYRLGGLRARHSQNWVTAGAAWEAALQLAVAVGDSSMALRLKGNLAVSLDKRGRGEQAVRLHREVQGTLESRGDTLGTLMVLRNLGMAQLRLADYRNAGRRFDRGIRLSRRMGREDQLGALLLNRGLLNYEQGRFGDAYTDYRMAGKILGAEMSRLDAANLANNLGMIRRVYGDSALARHNYGEALDICRSEGFSELESKVLNNLGNLEREAGRYESAIGLFESSLALKRWLEDRRGISVGLRNLGLVYLDLGDTRRARELLERSLEEARDIGYKQGEMESTFCLGDLERSLGRHERAEGRYLRAIEEAESLDAVGSLYQLHGALADSRRMAGRPAEAISRYELALACVEEIRRGIDLEAGRAGFMGRASRIYRSLIQLLLELGDEERAYEVYERMKARNLRDLLDGAEAVFESDLEEGELSERARAESELRTLNRRVTEYDESGSAPAEDLDGLVSRRRAARARVREARQGLFIRHPGLKRRIDPGPAIDGRRAVRLLNSREAALSYMLGEEDAFCFVLRRDPEGRKPVRALRLETDRAELLRLHEEFRRYGGRESLRELHRLLLAPLSGLLEDVTQLCIVPHGILHHVPFHALVDCESDRHLVEDFTVYYAHSLSVLSDLRTLGTSGREKILAVGHPLLESGGRITPGGVYHELPSTGREVRAIGRIFGERATLLLRDEARESAFKRLAPGFGMLHLASHGVVDEADPMHSALLLAGDAEDDGYLTAREIIGLKLNADLAVLSACESAGGALVTGEGLQGLSRAFMGARVPAVVASLWPVEDTSGQLLMEDFYRFLEAGMRPADALRRAQLRLLNSESHGDPHRWAPFVLIGDAE